MVGSIGATKQKTIVTENSKCSKVEKKCVAKKIAILANSGMVATISIGINSEI